jgi:hypothetical protein
MALLGEGATNATGSGSDRLSGCGYGDRLTVPWLAEDMLRLLRLLGAHSAAVLPSVSVALKRRLSEPVALLRKSEAESGDATSHHIAMLEMQEDLVGLEQLIGEASRIAGPPQTLISACEQLSALEAALQTEMRYVHGPDWELKPGRLITKKGTWIKQTTRFSWEIPADEKLYLPEGVALPVLQIARVTDNQELRLHEWSNQHLRVWLKPQIVRGIEARRHHWFVYWPHFEGDGTVILAATDTWLKRSVAMSGELQPFELLYVPKGMMIHLARMPEIVDEDWEKNRHPHANQHRRLVLASSPLTMRRDKYDLFVGQPEKDKAQNLA